MNTWHEDYTQALHIGDYAPPNVVVIAMPEPLAPRLLDYAWFWMLALRGWFGRLGYMFWLPVTVLLCAPGWFAFGWLVGRMW